MGGGWQSTTASHLASPWYHFFGPARGGSAGVGWWVVGDEVAQSGGWRRQIYFSFLYISRSNVRLHSVYLQNRPDCAKYVPIYIFNYLLLS